MIGSIGIAWMPLDELMQQLRSFADAVVQGLPSFLLAVVVVAVGWLIASLVARLLRAVLRRGGFSSGARSLLGHRALGAHDPAHVAASLVKWLLVAIAALLALDLLGFQLGQELAMRLRDALPRVVAASILLVVGSLVAMLLGAGTQRFFESAGVSGRGCAGRS